MGILVTGDKATGEKWRDNWITPDYIKDLVRACFGTDFFDPCPENPTKDALTIPWEPFSFINGPYSEFKAGKWLDHGLQQPSPQIWLAFSNTETVWWQRLAKSSTAICFVKKRIRFIDPRTYEKSEKPTQASTIFYRGDSPYSFKRHFDDMGIIVLPVV